MTEPREERAHGPGALAEGAEVELGTVGLEIGAAAVAAANQYRAVVELLEGEDSTGASSPS